MTDRAMFRYEVPIDDAPHTIPLSHNPVAVAAQPYAHVVEFRAEHVEPGMQVERVFQVFGTGHALPENARWAWHLPALRGVRVAPVRGDAVKGVSMTRVTYRPRAYCPGPDEDGSCTFERQAGTGFSVATLRAGVQRHVKDTGHTVRVDVVDRTSYFTEAAPAVTP